MARNLKHSSEGLIEAFEHHLAYEVNMLRACYACLAFPVPAFGQVAANAFIESFCVHARNLIDFFDERSATPGQADSDYVGARHFTASYKPWPAGGPSNDLRSRLNAQISHLTYDRSAQDERKIGPKERMDLMNLIEQELVHFQSHLRSPYRERWPFGDPNAPQVAIGSQSSATNAVQVASVQSGSEQPQGSSAPQYVLVNSKAHDKGS